MGDGCASIVHLVGGSLSLPNLVVSSLEGQRSDDLGMARGVCLLQNNQIGEYFKITLSCPLTNSHA